MIRLFVIEDHPIIIKGLKYEFRSSRDKIVITGSTAKISDVTDKVKSEEFDVFILDLWLGDPDPVENVKILKKKYPHNPIVIYTSEESPFWKEKMLGAGANAYIVKSAEKDELKTIIQRVAAGETVFPEYSFLNKDLTLQSLEVPRNIILKPWERQIFLLLSQGKSQKEIAELKHKSLSAIEKFVAKFRTQYNFNTTAEVIHYLTSIKEI